MFLIFEYPRLDLFGILNLIRIREIVDVVWAFGRVDEVHSIVFLDPFIELCGNVIIIQIACSIVADLLKFFRSSPGQVTLKEFHCRKGAHIDHGREQLVKDALPNLDSGLWGIFILAQLK